MVVPFLGTDGPFLGRSVPFFGPSGPFFGRSVPNIEFPNLQFPFQSKPHRPFRRFRATPAVRAAESAPFHQRPQQVTLCWPAQIRRHGADPFGYFEWAFEKLMHNSPEEQLEDLLPANWLKTRPAAGLVGLDERLLLLRWSADARAGRLSESLHSYPS